MPHRRTMISNFTWVHQLINCDTMKWRENIIYELFNETTAQIIIHIRLPYLPEPNVLKWTSKANGERTTKDAYTRDQEGRFTMATHLQLKTVEEALETANSRAIQAAALEGDIECFANRKVIVASRLSIDKSQSCFCYHREETLKHIILQCPF